MTRDSIGSAQYQVTGVILAHIEEIGGLWKRLLGYQPKDPGAAAVDALTDRSLLAFATYLRGDDSGRALLSQQWLALRPDQRMAADAVAAMSLFPEAVRQVLADRPELPLPLAEILAAAREFVLRTTTAVLQSIDLEPSEARWEEAARELEEQRDRRVARLGVLTEIARAVNTSDDLDSLFEQVHELCARVIPGHNFLISFYDAPSANLSPRLLYFQGIRRPELEQHPRPAGLIRVMAETQQPLAVLDYVAACAEHGVQPDPLVLQSPQPLHFMAAPMIQGGQTVGVIACFSPHLPFQPEDLELLAAAARQTAIALEIRRLIKAERKRVNQLRAVNQLAREIVARQDAPTLLQTAADLVHELFGYNLVAILLREGTDELVMRASAPRPGEVAPASLRLPIDEHSIVGSVAATGAAALVGDVAADPRYLATPQTGSTRAELAVPLARDGRVLGVLDVQSPELHAFDRHDLTTLATIADQIVVALQNAELLQDERERSRALALMLNTTRAAGSSLITDEVLEHLAGGIVDAAAARACAIYIFDPESKSFSPATVVGDWTLGRPTFAVERNPFLQRLLSQQQPFASCTLGAFSNNSDCACHGAPLLLVPLIARGQTLGLALVVAGDEHDFSPETVRLVQGVADSAALTVENARLYARSQGLTIAEERGRLAQEIHDGLAQGLTAISLQLDLADTFLPTKPAKALEKVRRALELTRVNLEDARRSVLDLSASRLHEVPLPEALRRLALGSSRAAGVPVDVFTEGLSGRLSARVETGLYRIAEEALENTRRHARAHAVRLSLQASDGVVRLTIEDDGVGFDPSQTARSLRPGSGFGLVGIRERARLLKGRLELESAAGAGTRLIVTVPYEASRRAEKMENEA